MSTRDVFIEKFRQLLREIPDDYSLPQWQFAYRQAIFLMGMQILERFPRDAVGPDPFAQGGPSGTQPRAAGAGAGPKPVTVNQDGSGGQTGGGHPHVVCKFTDLAAFVLCMQTQHPKDPGKPKK